MSSPVLKARAHVGVAARAGDPERLVSARRNLAAEKIQQYIEKVVAEAPPFTDAQRSKLTALLNRSA